MRVLITSFLVFAVHQIAIAETTNTETNPRLSAAEQALVDLMTNYYAELEIWWDAAGKTSAAREEAIAAGEIVDPGGTLYPSAASLIRSLRPGRPQTYLMSVASMQCEPSKSLPKRPPHHAFQKLRAKMTKLTSYF